MAVDQRTGETPDHTEPQQGERAAGLTFDSCYRHPDVRTGVHCTRCGRPICPDCMTQAPVGYHCPHCAGEAARGGRRTRLVIGGGLSVARVLLYANVAMFLADLVSGGQLSRFGAMVPVVIALQGEYWRLVTSMFLHVGIIHLALNMYALYLFGDAIEAVFGRATFVGIYFVSGFLGSVASYSFGSDPTEGSVGASGAIFALLGAWAAYNYRRRETALGSANLQSALTIVALSIVLGLVIPRIDNLAHLGGFIAGAGAGLATDALGHRRTAGLSRVGAFVAIALIGVALVAWRTSVITDTFSGLF